METQQIDPKAEEYAKRIDFYLKKKGLGHIKTNLLNAIAKLEIGMERDGVTYEDLTQHRASEEVLELAAQANKYQFVADAVLRKSLTESHKSKELENFDKEYTSQRDADQKTEEGSKAYEEATEKYKANMSKENFARMVKAKGIIIGGDVNGYTPSDKEQMEATHEQMRQKYQAQEAEQEKEEAAQMEALGKMANNDNDPDGQRLAKHLIQKNTINKIRHKENMDNLIEEEAEVEAKFAERR